MSRIVNDIRSYCAHICKNIGRFFQILKYQMPRQWQCLRNFATTFSVYKKQFDDILAVPTEACRQTDRQRRSQDFPLEEAYDAIA